MKIFVMIAWLACSMPAFGQLNMTFLSKVTYTEDLASVWGYASGGREYALVGVYSGLSIVDVTIPAAPVKLQLIPTESSSWHEMKTWGHYAYVVNENEGGLLIVDLSNLPGPVTYTYWTGGNLDLQSGHSIWIDENGIAYINGSNLAGGGVVFLDLNPDPTNPVYLGAYDDHYVHDSYVRGDTMWTAEIYEGWFRTVDVSVKSNPVVLAVQSTPGEFSHNTALSSDGRYLFTTDEVSNSYVTSYDVSDLSDITELDRFQASPGSKSIAHNVHLQGNYAVIAYYRDGVIIADVTHPNNMIKVASFDTSPLSGSGYNGCWEAYPYLPSGNILASDIEEGLFVLGVNYQNACYLEGNITHYTTGAALNGVSVSITGVSNTSTTSGLSGHYATGLSTPGSYNVKFSKSGFHTKTITHVSMISGMETLLNTTLKPTSLPACSAPSSLSVSGANNNSATLLWSDEYASQYTVKLKNINAGSTSSYTAYVNTLPVSGLGECTDYQFRVKAKCSSGSWTGFSSWFSFSTTGTSCGRLIAQQDPAVYPADFRAYPNPCNRQLHFELDVEAAGNITIQFADVSGRVLRQQHFELTTAGRHTLMMEMDGMAAGSYLCLLRTPEVNRVLRIVKQ